MKRDLKSLIVEHGRSSSTLKDIELDVEKLSDRLMQKYHINLKSRSLLKIYAALRMKTHEKPKRKTLDRLSIFAGFQNWDELQHAFMGD